MKLRRQVERVIVPGEDLIKALHACSFHWTNKNEWVAQRHTTFLVSVVQLNGKKRIWANIPDFSFGAEVWKRTPGLLGPHPDTSFVKAPTSSLNSWAESVFVTALHLFCPLLHPCEGHFKSCLLYRCRNHLTVKLVPSF